MDQQSRRLDGTVIVELRLRWRVLAALAVFVVCAALGFAVTATYARMELVSGWVVPEGGLVRVTARPGGIIEALDIAEGDRVAVGDHLASLRLLHDLEDGDTGQAIARQIDMRIDAQRLETDAENRQLEVEEANLRRQKSGLQAELAEAEMRLEMTADRVTLSDNNLNRLENLAEAGHVSSRALEEAQGIALTVRQDLTDGRAARMALERQVDDLRAQLDSLPLLHEAARARGRAARAALDQSRTEASATSQYRATASIPGRVVGLPHVVGAALEPQQTIAILSPEDGALQAELYVPTRAAGFIQQGQEVRIMYQAFPFQRHGTAAGRIEHISATVLAPHEVSIPGLEFPEPVFRVTASLEREEIEV